MPRMDVAGPSPSWPALHRQRDRHASIGMTRNAPRNKLAWRTPDARRFRRGYNSQSKIHSIRLFKLTAAATGWSAPRDCRTAALQAAVSRLACLLLEHVADEPAAPHFPLAGGAGPHGTNSPLNKNLQLTTVDSFISRTRFRFDVKARPFFEIANLAIAQPDRRDQGNRPEQPVR